MSARLSSPRTALVVALAAVGLIAAGCSSSAGGSSAGATSAAAATTPAAAADLGTPNAATGTPIVFGLLNLESGPVTFPEFRRPSRPRSSTSTTTRAASAATRSSSSAARPTASRPRRSAAPTRSLDKKPVAILGGADTGAPGAFPVWTAANLAYLGGIPFTPVEQNYTNAVIFSSVSTATTPPRRSTRRRRSASRRPRSSTPTTRRARRPPSASSFPTMTNAGVTDDHQDPGAADRRPTCPRRVATAIGAHPDLIYVNAPAACPNILKSLKQLGNTAKIMGIDPCTSPPAIAGANGGAEGLYFASPIARRLAGTDQTNLFLAALEKYGAGEHRARLAGRMGFQTVMNVQAALGKFTTADLTTDKILAAFRTGSVRPQLHGPRLHLRRQAAAGPPRSATPTSRSGRSRAARSSLPRPTS